MNIDQGDSSRKPAAADFSNLEPSVASEAAGAATADGAGAAGGEIAAGCDVAGACCAAGAVTCCADDGDTGESIASATITP